MLLGKEAIISSSWKQKVNVQSSTKCDVVGANGLPDALHSQYFIEAQEGVVTKCIIFQDIKIRTSIEKYG